MLLVGLSLGEYTALINSGKISLEEGVKLVQKRGQYMRRIGARGWMANGSNLRNGRDASRRSM